MSFCTCFSEEIFSWFLRKGWLNQERPRLTMNIPTFNSSMLIFFKCKSALFMVFGLRALSPGQIPIFPGFSHCIRNYKNALFSHRRARKNRRVQSFKWQNSKRSVLFSSLHLNSSLRPPRTLRWIFYFLFFKLIPAITGNLSPCLILTISHPSRADLNSSWHR